MKYEIICGCDRPHTIFKAATSRALIDRDRPAIRRQRMKLRIVVKKFLKAQAPKIAAQVLRARDDLAKGKSDVDRILAALNFADWTVLSGDLDGIIEKILADAGAQALAQIGVSEAEITTMVNDRAVAYAQERSAELVTRISESTREMLRADVTEAMQEGYSNDDLADTLAENYGFSGDRAEMIARTETAYADVAGNLEAYRASGVVAGKKWITGEGCCDLCDELNGEIIGIDDTFPTDDGDIDGPPYHPNCRCDVVPILDTEMADEGD